jgi:hypothetical protein
MVVGFILASLLRKKKRNPVILPSIKGKFSVEHDLPGRIRFGSPLLEDARTEVTQEICGEMNKIEGIRSVKINPHTGSLLVLYDEVRIQKFIVHSIAIKVLGLEEEFEKKPEGLLSNEVGLIGRALNQQIYQASAGILDLKSTLMVTFLTLAIYQIILRRDRALPGGFNLLWWFYILSQRGN